MSLNRTAGKIRTGRGRTMGNMRSGGKCSFQNKNEDLRVDRDSNISQDV